MLLSNLIGLKCNSSGPIKSVLRVSSSLDSTSDIWSNDSYSSQGKVLLVLSFILCRILINRSFISCLVYLQLYITLVIRNANQLQRRGPQGKGHLKKRNGKIIFRSFFLVRRRKILKVYNNLPFWWCALICRERLSNMLIWRPHSHRQNIKRKQLL